MKTTPAALVALLLFLQPESAAAISPRTYFEQRCESEMKPRLEVVTHEFGFQVLNNLSSGVLNGRGTRSYASELLIGMTALQSRTEIEMDAPGLVDTSRNLECVAPKVRVNLTFPRMDVYVAREFSPGSCSFREILAHEMQHVAIYREQLPRLERLIRARLNERFANRPLYAPNGAGITALEREVDDWLRPMIQTELKIIEDAQMALDTPEEDHRLTHACFGEVSSRMGIRW
ncbi:MAG: hypothetical protein V4508_10130 [Pseudomonadota bacterium]